MSVSDNSTIAPSSDIDSLFQSLDEHVGTGSQVGAAKRCRRLRRPLRPVAYAESTEMLKPGNELSFRS